MLCTTPNLSTLRVVRILKSLPYARFAYHEKYVREKFHIWICGDMEYK